jgi:hypothetical protein
MSELKNVIGVKEFRQRLKEKLIQIDNNIKESDLYFFQTTLKYLK